MPIPAAAAAGIRVGGKLLKKGTKAYKEYKRKQKNTKAIAKENKLDKQTKGNPSRKDRAAKAPKKPQATKNPESGPRTRKVYQEARRRQDGLKPRDMHSGKTEEGVSKVIARRKKAPQPSPGSRASGTPKEYKKTTARGKGATKATPKKIAKTQARRRAASRRK